MFDSGFMELPKGRAVAGALVVLSLFQAGCVVGWAAGLSSAVYSLWAGLGFGAPVFDLASFAVCFIGLQVVRFAQDVLLERWSFERACELRDGLLARAFSRDELLASRIGSARVAALANGGIDDVQAYLRVVPPKAVGLVAISLPLLACEFAVDWVSGVILAVMLPVTVFFMVLIGTQARERSERQYESYTRLTGRFMDSLRGLPVLKAFGAQDVEAESVRANSEGVRVATVRMLRMATLSSAVLDLCAVFGVAAVAIMLAFRLMDGSLGLFTGLLALVLAPEFFAPIRAFASDYHASLDGKNALAAVMEIGQRPRSPLSGSGQRATGALSGSAGIMLRDVACRHGDGVVGVEGVTLSARAPEKIAVVGASGAGKSTLAGVFAGFLEPTSGSVEVSEGWERCVRYVPQAPYVFRASIEDNVRFYRPDATRAEVEEAVRAVGLDGLVSQLPEGLDTVIGDGGRGLSGGEAHRVALARILLDREARVLVFDEPTAHLDIETERDLKPAMLAAMEGKLVLFATHRLHWVADMDRVVRLEDGRVVSDEVVA